MADHPERAPFAKHKYYYLFLKMIVIIAAAYLAARYLWLR